MHRGYMALWRKFFDHPFWTEPREFSKAEAWIDILREAQYQHEPKEVVLGMKVLTQQYGECLYSTRTWAKRWMWSESRVRRFFKMLEKMKMISQKSEGITTRIKVINYATYDPKRRANDANPTQMRRTSDADAATTKEGKKESTEERKHPPLPPFIDPAIWARFVEHRKTLKPKMTKNAAELIIAKLGRFHENGIDPNEALKLSIENGWKGVFEPKGRNGTGHSIEDKQAQACADWLQEEGVR